MSKHESLVENLRRHNAGLAAIYLVLRTSLAQMQNRWCSSWPEGNDHGPDHIDRVLENLARLVGSSPIDANRLSAFEVFLALTGATAHDVGIVHGREEHAQRSAQIIREISQRNELLLDEAWLDILRAIIVCHSSSANIEEVCPVVERTIAGEQVRPRRLSALVRLADELDEDFRRAQKWIQRNVKVPPASEPYWRFSQRISGIRIEDVGQDIVVDVNLKPEDFADSRLPTTGQTFLEFMADKFAKINCERTRCMKHLAPDFVRKRLTVRVVERPGGLGPLPQFDFNDEMGENATAAKLGARRFLDALEVRSQRKATRPRSTPSLSQGRGRNALAAPATHEDHAVVNAFKLFFFRSQKQLSVYRLAQDARVEPQLIQRLEQVNRAHAPDCFKSATRNEVARIEAALNCVGRLEYGQADDLLAAYLMYYMVNYRTKRHGSGKNSRFNFAPDTKAVVFDFGGTLTKRQGPLSTWEKMWTAVGYSVEDAGQLHKQFIIGKLSHQAWCDITCDRLRAKNFSRGHMKKIIAEIELVPGLKSTFEKLQSAGISVYIVSGSVREIIVEKLNDAFPMVKEVKANEIVYDDAGVIKAILGHSFDFAGKAEYIKRVANDLKCAPIEVLFVGNSLNDTWASESGARTLCVNPSLVNPYDTRCWTDFIQDMSNLEEVLPFAQGRA